MARDRRGAPGATPARAANRPSRHALALGVVRSDATFSRMVVRGDPAWVGRCIHCNSRIVLSEDGRGATLEHIVPRCHGGSDELRNLALACARCNQLKGTRTDVLDADDPGRRRLEQALQAKRLARYRDPE